VGWALACAGLSVPLFRSRKTTVDTILPPDLPNRDRLIATASRHLELIAEANKHFNLTRITDARAAAIKHVLDSVLPWDLFSDAKHVLDAGSGAGFPGIPLSVVLPNVQFTLSESIGKKARFLEQAVSDLKLPNVRVAGMRAEDYLRGKRADIITARAVAPISRASALFAAALKQGSTALLYKGPDAQIEINDAAAELRKWKQQATIVRQYDLPDDAGSRTIVQLTRG
jgi:16S rRNA (guanine527-N7)-methyltransferase